MYKDPIAAIATPYGVGSISVIRCSGEGSISLINNIFKGKSLTKAKANTINYGYIIDGEDIIDEVLVSIFKAPKSFTGEESCEISCHGGIYNTNRVLELILNSGFRLAEPGEFSKRAFLNGRIDMAQAESIMDIISSSNELALKASIHSLRRGTTKLIEELREKLLDLIASIEVNIDYPEYDDAITMTNDIIMPKLNSVIKEMELVLKHSNIGVQVVHGIKTAIVGRPNVGKSSLLNMMLEEEKAIVTDIAGTTRDLVEGSLSLGNITLNLIDTAGIRDANDVVERIGIERSLKAASEADLVLLVLDSSRKLEDEDRRLLELTKDKPRIVILNKTDLKQITSFDGAIKISALKEEGLESLVLEIERVTQISSFNVNDTNYLSNARHISKMKEALASLYDAKESCEMMLDVDMVEIDIKDAWNKLGEIIGQTAGDLLLNELFSKFCLGK